MKMLRLKNYVQGTLAHYLRKTNSPNKRFLADNKSSTVVKTNVKVKTSALAFNHQPDYKFKEGKQYEGFECTRTEQVPEFGVTSYTFRHLKTGTELWYLDRADTNNVFSINFRTTPFDSTGLPHILEHSVLCGSQKYPVRDPFFKMLNRSVATFMNAMTAPDYTLYPFSTMNETDYRNLQKIYLDAVFRPNLKYLDFLQEGWRLEHSDVHNKESDYVIKGVVYNEMKGAFSENSSVFGQNLLNNLLPNHTYGYVSGGNPLEIPKLTHANLVDFHKKYYHPSNSRIYAYGCFDLNETLCRVNAEYLDKYDCIDNSYSRIPNQKRWEKPRNVHISSRYDNMGAPFEKQNQIAIALLMNDVNNIDETFTLSVLTELMVRGPNATFYQTLIEPNFSGGYNQTTGYDPQIKDTFFCVGLQDLKVEDFNKVQEIYEKTIQQVMEKGFEDKHIDSVLHNIELALKHQTPMFGLGLLFNCSPLWNHDGNVVQSLHVSKYIENFRKELKNDKDFLKKKVEQYFACNNHKLTLTMSPDDTYESKFQTAELELLKQKIIGLDTEKRKEIYENGLALEAAQKAPPNIELLPCLTIDDVKEPPKLVPVQILKVDHIPTQLCHVHTNKIVYLKAFFDTTCLSREEILQLPLFCEVLTEMGTKKYNYRDLDKVITSKTSGINLKTHFTENIYDCRTYKVGVYLSTHALEHNVSDMFNICQEILTNFNLEDEERLKMLIDSYISNISTGIAQSGHLYAMQSCSGLVTDAAKLKSDLMGVEHIDVMKRYTKENTTKQILSNLYNLGKKIFQRNSLRIALNAGEDYHSDLMDHYTSFLDCLPNDKNEPLKGEKNISLLAPSYQHFVMNIPVNYCAKSFFTVPYTHRDHPALRVLTKFISAKYLLPVVREQNGAYGSGVKVNHDGIVNFYSYRDPHSTKTLKAFDQTYEWLQKQKDLLNDQALFEAKLGVLQQLDAPIAPGNIGIDYFLYGVSEEMFLKYRSRMLSLTIKDLLNAADNYFKKESSHHGKCILGPENKDLEAQTNLKWNTVL